jgi:hypothetical protein
MAIAPGTYSPTIQRRADYVLPLEFKDGNDAAINLTGWTVLAQVWNQARTTKYCDFTTTYTNRAAGSISIALTYTQTSTLPDECYYDVMLINGSGLREYYLEGILYVSEGYTAP